MVTNRHVALLLARADAGRFRFLVGSSGAELAVSMDSRHEYQINASAAVAVKRVLWIEMNERRPDIAFLEVDGRTDGTSPSHIKIAKENAGEGTPVAAIVYPARGTPDVVPNQAWMDRIYGGVYEVKRVAPGLITGIGERGISHDCTTLGGNSGSAVVRLKDGLAVGLHYQGLYLVNNDAVPVSVINQYLKERPWQGDGRGRPAEGPTVQDPQTPTSSAEDENDEITVTVPITIKVRVGKAKVGPPTGGDVDFASSGVEARDHQCGRRPATHLRAPV